MDIGIQEETYEIVTVPEEAPRESDTPVEAPAKETPVEVPAGA